MLNAEIFEYDNTEIAGVKISNNKTSIINVCVLPKKKNTISKTIIIEALNR